MGHLCEAVFDPYLRFVGLTSCRIVLCEMIRIVRIASVYVLIAGLGNRLVSLPAVVHPLLRL